MHKIIKLIFICLLFLNCLAFNSSARIGSTIYYKSVVYNPETLSKWMTANLAYQKDTRGYWKTPYETLDEGGGDCEDFARLAGTVLEKLGYKGYIVIVIFQSKVTNRRQGHAIYMVQEKDKTWSVFSNTEYIPTRTSDMLTPIYRKYLNWVELYVYNTDKQRLIKHTRKIYTIK